MGDLQSAGHNYKSCLDFHCADTIITLMWLTVFPVFLVCVSTCMAMCSPASEFCRALKAFD